VQGFKRVSRTLTFRRKKGLLDGKEKEEKSVPHERGVQKGFFSGKKKTALGSGKEMRLWAYWGGAREGRLGRMPT